MYDYEDDQEPSLLEQLKSKAKKALGLDNPDTKSSQIAEGVKTVQKLGAPQPKKESDSDGLLVGDSRGVIHENVRTLKGRGLSEEEAIKRAQAAADRATAAKKKK